MAQHIHIHVSMAPQKTKDAVAPASVRNHSQFTQSDYDYLKGKGWSDKEITKRWDEEAGRGVAPQKGNKNAKPGEPGYLRSLHARDAALETLQTAYNEAKRKLDELGKEPAKPSPENRAFGSNGREKAAKELVEKYDASVREFNSYRTKYLRLKKAEVEASNALFHAKKDAGK